MKPYFRHKAFTSNGGSLRFDLWKHGIVDILSFPIKQPTMELTIPLSYLTFFLSLSPPSYLWNRKLEIAELW